MKKLIIFDLDGTILDTLPTIAYYGNLALSENGFDTIEEKKYKDFLGFGRNFQHGRNGAEDPVQVDVRQGCGICHHTFYLTFSE